MTHGASEIESGLPERKGSDPAEYRFVFFFVNTNTRSIHGVIKVLGIYKHARSTISAKKYFHEHRWIIFYFSTVLVEIFLFTVEPSNKLLNFFFRWEKSRF